MQSALGTSQAKVKKMSEKDAYIRISPIPIKLPYRFTYINPLRFPIARSPEEASLRSLRSSTDAVDIDKPLSSA